MIKRNTKDRYTMYLEIKEFLEKINKLLNLSENEKNELEHILFEIWDSGYQKGLNDGCKNE
jgi:hypothetical protein